MSLFNLFRKAPVAPKETAFKPSVVTDAMIIDAAGEWMRYCAVSAFNGTISTSGNLDFETWLSCCRTTWIAEVSMRLDVSADRVCSAIRQFARANAQRESGLLASLNKSMTVS